MARTIEKLQILSKDKTGKSNKEFLDINDQLSNNTISGDDLLVIKRIGQQHASNLKAGIMYLL